MWVASPGARHRAPLPGEEPVRPDRQTIEPRLRVAAIDMPERQREGDHVGEPDRDPGGEQLKGIELSLAKQHLLNQNDQIRQR